jgi:hypothetical protein
MVRFQDPFIRRVHRHGPNSRSRRLGFRDTGDEDSSSSSLSPTLVSPEPRVSDRNLDLQEILERDIRMRPAGVLREPSDKTKR